MFCSIYRTHAIMHASSKDRIDGSDACHLFIQCSVYLSHTHHNVCLHQGIGLMVATLVTYSYSVSFLRRTRHNACSHLREGLMAVALFWYDILFNHLLYGVDTRHNVCFPQVEGRGVIMLVIFTRLPPSPCTNHT